MGGENEIPLEVTALVHRSLPTMVHIELLLLLARTAPKEWTRHALAAELRSSPALVAAALADLETARLAESLPGAEPPQHRLGAGDEATRQTIAKLQDVYDRLPVTLIKMLYNRPPSAAKAFADAFRVRPSEERP